jgi:predicted nucleic acid binding AN1-type Zn finger protein
MDVRKKRCDHCRKQALILIECSLCRKQFCIHDRAPETHACHKMDVYKERPEVIEKIFTPKIEYI